MKSLGSNSTGAREGIGIAVCTTFLEFHFDMNEIERIAESVGTGGFLSFIDSDLGTVILNHSDICDRFLKYLADNRDVKHIWSLSNSEPKRGFIAHVDSTFGAYLKTTQWWRDNLKEIEKMRRKVKIVQKVMEG